MLPFYIAALTLGGVLIAASVFLGGGDHDADHDVDHDFDADADPDFDVDADADADLDHDHDHDHEHSIGEAAQGDLTEAGLWLPFLTMRFWTFALATFGATGALLTVLDFSQLLVAPLSAVFGIGLGWGIALVFRNLKRDNVTGSTGLNTLQGRDGTVLLPVGPGKLGKVRLLVDGQHLDLLATTKDAVLIEIKEPVLVVDVVDGQAVVTSARTRSAATSATTADTRTRVPRPTKEK